MVLALAGLSTTTTFMRWQMRRAVLFWRAKPGRRRGKWGRARGHVNAGRGRDRQGTGQTRTARPPPTSSARPARESSTRAAVTAATGAPTGSGELVGGHGRCGEQGLEGLRQPGGSILDRPGRREARRAAGRHAGGLQRIAARPLPLRPGPRPGGSGCSRRGSGVRAASRVRRRPRDPARRRGGR